VNRRRLVLAVLGAGALTAPLVSFAQQQRKVWRVGVLTSGSAGAIASDGAFRQGMRELGYVEGRNLVVERRSAEGKADLLPGLAAELVALKVDVIVVVGSPATSAAQKATTTIPIVMGNIGDPVGGGFVKSLARPAGNITGLTNMGEEVRVKQLEMLLALVPRLSRLAILVNPSNATNVRNSKAVAAEGQKRGIRILRAEARTPQEIDKAFSWIHQQNADALILWTEPFFSQQKRQIVELAAKYRLPTVTQGRAFPEAGGLMSYGPNDVEQYRRAATYVDKILKGARPGDLPVEQPTKFELVISGKTAKALGLTIPQSLLISADRVIE
jgi:putative ABC transport system substrate-binding protein